MLKKEFLDDLAMIKTEYSQSYDFTISQAVKEAISAYDPTNPTLATAWRLCQAIADDNPLTSFGFIARIQKQSKLIECVSLLKNNTNLLATNQDVFNQMVEHKSLTWFHHTLKRVIECDPARLLQQDHSGVYFNLIMEAPCAEISSYLILFLMSYHCPDHAKEQFSLIWKTFIKKEKGEYVLSEDGESFVYNFNFDSRRSSLPEHEKHGVFLEQITRACSESEDIIGVIGAPKTLNRLQLLQATELLVSQSLIPRDPSDDNVIQGIIRQAIQISDGYEPPQFSPLAMAEAMIALNRTLDFIQPIYFTHRGKYSLFDHEYRCEIEREGRVISSRPGNLSRSFTSSMGAVSEYQGYLIMLFQAISEKRDNPKKFVNILNEMHRPGLLDQKDRLSLFEGLLFSGYGTISQKLQSALKCREEELVEQIKNLTEPKLLSMIDSEHDNVIKHQPGVL